MAFVAAATSVGAAVLGTGAAAGIGSTIVGGALIGAGVGGLYSGITGDGNILNSMLTGGLIGGGIGGIGAAMFPGAAGIAPASTTAGLTPGAAAAAPSTAAAPTANVVTPTVAMTGANTPAAAAANAANLEALAIAEGSPTAGMVGAANTGLPTNTVLPASMQFTPPVSEVAKTGAGLTGKEMLGYGLAGTAALSLLGGMRPKGAIAPASANDLGMIRPYEYNANPIEATGIYPAPYATASYDAAGNPVLDTRERTYFNQTYTPLQPYSAASGGLMSAPPVPGLMQSGPANVNFMGQDMYPTSQQDRSYYATPTQMPTSAQATMANYEPKTNPLTGQMTANMASGGEVDLEEERQKLIMKNIKGASTKELEQMMKQMDEQEFLRRNMPAYAEAMRPSISGMVEGAQYGDRMAQSFGATPRDVMVMPTVVDPQSKTFGGIASIGQQLDPDTRLRMMADIQRTPFDRSALEAVRRVGAGIDRKIGKDASLSAFYEQDPMGRNKMGGARFTQRFEQGGISNLGGYSDGGRMLKGPGDGMSDDIPGVIGGKQPARLADGEFVVPADVVSHLGNGSTDAGAKRLYAMMDKVRKARTGTKKQGKQIKAEKYLPA